MPNQIASTADATADFVSLAARIATLWKTRVARAFMAPLFRTSFFLVAIGGSLVACSALVSFDGYEGNANALDANTSDTKTSPNDGSIDAPNITIDGATEASTICPGFCDNFDDRTTVLGAWNDVQAIGTGDVSTMSITSSVFLSAPHSLQAHVAALATGNSEGVLLHAVLPLHAGQMAIDFDVKLVPDPSGYQGYVNFLQLGIAGNYAGSLTALEGTIAADYWVNFSDGGHIQPDVALPNAVDSNWHHAHYAAVYDPGTNGSILAALDGTTILSVEDTMTYQATPPGTFDLSIGYVDNAPWPAMDIYIDNVVVQ